MHLILKGHQTNAGTSWGSGYSNLFNDATDLRPPQTIVAIPYAGDILMRIMNDNNSIQVKSLSGSSVTSYLWADVLWSKE